MGLEIEVKILNINIEYEKDKILKKGGKFIGEFFQQLFTYDLLSIYGRFQEIIMHLNSDNIVEIEVNYEKLKNLFWEVDQYEYLPDLSFLGKSNLVHFSDILIYPDWKDIVKNFSLISYMKQFNNNPKNG